MKLAITGLGLVSPFGVGRPAWHEALMQPSEARGRAFAGPSEVLTEYPHARTAEVWGWAPEEHLGKKGHRSNDRLTKFLIAAARYALEDALIKKDGEFIPGAPRAEQIGICSATAYGSLDAITELNRVAELEDPRYINPTRFPNTVINAAAGYVSIWQDLRAPNTTIVDGNCGSLDAVLTAETHLRRRRAQVFLVGGGEVVSEPLYLALSKLGVLATDGQPGLEMGEGACYAVLEEEHHAQERGARIQGFVRGYGTAFEPPKSEALLIHVDPLAVSRAIEQALDDAEVSVADVDLVIAARSGFDQMDQAEVEGLTQVFGGDVPAVALKQLHGETFGAAGAFGMAAAASYFAGAPAAPLTTEIGGDLRRQDLRTVVIISIGYYGNVSAVVLQSPSAGASATESPA